MAVARAAESWTPDGALGLCVDEIRDAIREAAKSATDWVLHPCMSRVTQPEPACGLRDLIVAAWVAGNTSFDGDVELTSPTVLWSAAGDNEIAAGHHNLRTLGTAMLARAPVQPALDLWCRTTGIVSAGSWACLDGAEFDTLEADAARFIRDFLALMSALAQRTPRMLAWVCAATRVVRPLVPVPRYARSSHDPDVPGLIEADLSRGPSQTIELIAHETAHLHLRAAQAAGALVDPSHQQTYHSPLRPEPRPLMGIVLAYHALAYICAALREGSAAGILNPDSVSFAADDLGRRRDDARATIDGARQHLTDAGVAFMARTHEVAEYVVG
jgi:HEXXH motif-containing protein